MTSISVRGAEILPSLLRDGSLTCGRLISTISRHRNPAMPLDLSGSPPKRVVTAIRRLPLSATVSVRRAGRRAPQERRPRREALH